MRVSRGGLLVLLAFTAPLIVEFRTVLGFFNIDMTAAGTVALGVVLVSVIVFWATLPERDSSGSTT